MANVDEPEDSEDLVFGEDEGGSRPAPSPQSQPVKNKVIYYMDRVFLCFLALLLLVLMLEIVYKIWYLTNWSGILRHLEQLAQWLSEPGEEEETAEL